MRMMIYKKRDGKKNFCCKYGKVRWNFKDRSFTAFVDNKKNLRLL